MINKIEDTDYFIYGFNKKMKIMETNIPIYIQILDESNIRLYDMIKTVGGEVVGLKVDCAIIKNINNTSYDNKEWGGYRMCDVPSLKNNEIYDNITFTTDGEWIDYDYEDSDQWEDIMKIAIDNKGLLLQASAGNGKTYTAKNIASKLREKGEGVKILAPTNKAALNIGGSTIHSFLKLSNGTMNKKYIDTIKKAYKYIIIDEISMITKELWRILSILKKETDIIFILLGDEKQCPPVEDENINDYFNHSAVKYLCNNNRNILNVRKRYDETLYNLLKDVSNIKTNEFKPLDTQRNICYLNATRKKINHLWNDKLKNENDLFISADPDDILTQDIYLYLEMPIIAKKTRREGGEILVANSETFNIGNIDETTISLYTQRPDANGEKYLYIYECLIEEFNKYFLINYCSTTHKAQGETITENYTIYDWSFMCEKIKYTAMSRAKNCDQITFKL
jgi:ATP-dependent exoDNAse (exonuclease V) alpha subunit